MEVKSYETHIFELRMKELNCCESWSCVPYIQVPRCNEITLIDSNYRLGVLRESWFVSDLFLFTRFTHCFSIQQERQQQQLLSTATTTTSAS